MSKARTILAAAFLLALASGPTQALAGAAGYTASPAPGARIRASVVERHGDRLVKRDVEGTLVALDDSTLMMKPTSTRRMQVIPRADLARLQVQVQGSRRGQGALIGLGVGAVLGAMIGFADGDDSGGMLSFTAEEKAGMLAIALAPVGAIIGAVAAPGAQWETVPGAHLSVGVTACSGRRAGVFLVARF